MLAINKPAGVLTHGDGKKRSVEETADFLPTVADWFVFHYPESAQVGEEPIETAEGGLITRPGIVHRLDRDTSGVMLLAKTDEGHAHLKSQFQEHTVTKLYRAWVYGAMKQDEYNVDAAIGRAKTFGRWSAIPKALRGRIREARTDVTVLERYPHTTDPNAGHSLIEARPYTGRTHQIRVHLQYLNHPIIADPLYSGKRNQAKDNLGFERQALHAYQITVHDMNAEELTVNADLPEDFTNIKYHA